VNRSLRREYLAWLAAAEWDVALLQEAPPRWLQPLCEATGASGALALTSRNFLPRLRGLLAELNTDLVGSDEGGSNQILVRPPWRIRGPRRLAVATRPERRRMLWARLEAPGRGAVAVGNVHLSTHAPTAVGEARVAAARALDWADGLPLVLGGDFNFRQARIPGAYEALAHDFGLAPPTAPDAIDHLLVRGLELEASPRALPPERRDIAGPDGLRIRLSDHAPVVARIAAR
jgi:endonuclease/exonuclease/phosphatase family metal-dependent hydrolase